MIFFFKTTSPNPHQNKERRLLLHLETEFLKTHQHLFINRIAIRHEFQSPPLHRRAPWPPKPAPAPLLPTGSLTVTFSWGNVEEREGRADFAYIIIIFKTQSASQTDQKKKKSPTLMSPTHLCYKLSQDLGARAGSSNAYGQGEKEK